jgi:hypothetical protein
VRDLASADPWQESLERSLARRGKLPDGKAPTARRGRERPQRRPAYRSASRPSSRERRRRHLTLGSGIAAAMVLVLITGSAFGGGGPRVSAATGGSVPGRHRVVIGRNTAFVSDGLNFAGTCQPVPRSSGYLNPLERAVVRAERIDQGVDYAGRGSLVSIGSARITYAGTSATGWPGAFIEYRLLEGPDSGCFVYYAEGIEPVRGLHSGQTVRAGQELATIIPGWSSGIELGWGAGKSTKTYAARTHAWTPTDDADDVATNAGKSFSLLIAELGGPPGRIEG